jgi:predicted nucleic acid-binding protein
MNENAIVNNTVLSNFAVVDRLELLKDVFGKIYITPEVYAEVENGIKCGHIFQKYTKQVIDFEDWILIVNLNQNELDFYKQLIAIVDSGEASCLAVARKGNWLFLTDDHKARTIARKSEINFSGTIGILKSAMSRNLISQTEAEKILQEMIFHGYYSPVEKISDI